MCSTDVKVPGIEGGTTEGGAAVKTGGGAEVKKSVEGAEKSADGTADEAAGIKEQGGGVSKPPQWASRRTRKDLELLHRIVAVIHGVGHRNDGVVDHGSRLMNRITRLIGDHATVILRDLISGSKGRHRKAFRAFPGRYHTAGLMQNQGKDSAERRCRPR